jgi:putative peptide zinc metalloprotease protein
VGVLLAIWAIILQLVLPLIRHIKFLMKDGRLQRQRTRALGVTGLGMVMLGVVLFAMPAPLWTMAEGVVWLPEQSRIRAGTDCFVTALLAQTDTAVQTGDPVASCEDPLLSAQVRVLDARLRELRAQHTLAMMEDRVEAQSIKQDMQAVAKELYEARQQVDELVLRSPSDGQLVVPGSSDLEGRFVRRGDTLAYVINDAATRARVIVTQADIGLVRQQTDSVEIRMAGQPGRAIAARVHSEVPAASDELPSKALGTRGGGMIPVDPADESGTRALATLFQFELELQDDLPAQLYGQRVYVRFDHGAEPLGIQWQRSLRQLFMREFGV